MAAFLVSLLAAGWRPGEPFPGGHDLLAASGAAFMAVVFGQMANAFACRSSTRWPGALGWTTQPPADPRGRSRARVLADGPAGDPRRGGARPRVPARRGLARSRCSQPRRCSPSTPWTSGSGRAAAPRPPAVARAAPGTIGTSAGGPADRCWFHGPARCPGPDARVGGAATGGPPPLLRAVERPVPSPAPDEVLVRVRVVRRVPHRPAPGRGRPASQGPRGGPRPRGRRRGRRDGRRRHRVRPSGTGWGSPGCGVPAGSAAGAGPARRTCAAARSTPAGTPTAASRSTPSSPAAYAYRLPDGFSDVAGRPAAVRRDHRLPRAAGVPRLPPGGRLGIYGFGASAHITAQIALAQGAEVHVLTRGEGARRLALELGAASAGDAYDRPPVPLDSAILFAPAGDLVPLALEALDQNGTLALAGIHLSDIPLAVLRAAPVPGADADQRHRQHPCGRRGPAPAGLHARPRASCDAVRVR